MFLSILSTPRPSSILHNLWEIDKKKSISQRFFQKSFYAVRAHHARTRMPNSQSNAKKADVFLRYGVF